MQDGDQNCLFLVALAGRSWYNSTKWDIKHVAISLHDMYAGKTMLYLVPRLGDDTLMSFVVCIVLYLYIQCLLLILLIEIDIRRRAEDALNEKIRELRMVVEELLRPLLLNTDSPIEGTIASMPCKSRTTTQWVDCLIQPIFIMLLFVRGESASCAAKEIMPY